MYETLEHILSLFRLSAFQLQRLVTNHFFAELSMGHNEKSLLLVYSVSIKFSVPSDNLFAEKSVSTLPLKHVSTEPRCARTDRWNAAGWPPGLELLAEFLMAMNRPFLGFEGVYRALTVQITDPDQADLGQKPLVKIASYCSVI